MKTNKLLINTFLRPAVLTVFALIVFAGLSASRVNAQSALDGFDPNANNIVRAVVVQPDGKILVSGDFTTIGGVTRNNIARLNADGTLDTAFNPNANGVVLTIAVQSDGRILVGGQFTIIGGQARNNIARLDGATGAADTSFNPNANGAVFVVTVQPDGKILVGGNFNGANSIGGQTRNYIVRLDGATGAADTAFNPNANNTILAIAVQSDGKILVGGAFTTIGGQTRNNIARLDGATGAVDSFNPNANGTVRAVAIQPDGKILVGGAFSGANGIGGQTRTGIARLDGATGAADSWNPNANNDVYTVAVQSDGKILVGGLFNGANSIGGQARNRIARLDAVTGAADSFDPNPNNPVLSIAAQSDGKIVVVGAFNTVGGQTRNGIARLERDGRLDQTLDVNTVGNFINAAAVQPDGKIIIGGQFSSVLGTTRNYIARLNADGTLDTAFNPNANADVYTITVQPDGKILIGGIFTSLSPNGGSAVTRNYFARLNADGTLDPTLNLAVSPNGSYVLTTAVQPDGKILIGGTFVTVLGVTRNRIARVNADGTLDTAFDAKANNTVYSITVQSDGKILISGSFTTLALNGAAAVSRNRIARLNADGTLDTAFNPNANNDVYAVAVQSDGRILLGGNFITLFPNNETTFTRNRIARVNADGTIDAGFDPNANDDVYSIAVQSDGKILLGGIFSTLSPNGAAAVSRNNIARLNADGATDTAFDPSADRQVYSIAIQPDGKILLGGFFTAVGGQPRNLFARLSNDTAALSSLSVTKTTVTLTRSGSAAQFLRVIFEQSVDNGATYTFLGTATNSFAAPAGNDIAARQSASAVAQAAGYTLTGQNIPTGQNVLIRARGFYRTGLQNSSETTEDKVQSVFLLGSTAAAVSVGGRVFAGQGRGLTNARVYLTAQNGETRTTTTSAFGYYHLNDIAAEQTVILTVNSKRYRFTPQVVSAAENVSDLNFYAAS